jgi:acetyl esterase/lipase
MRNKAASGQRYDLQVADVEYLRHDGHPLLARIFKPLGNGPFPLVVDLHGGAWCLGDRHRDTVINEALASSGVVVAALDFRMPPVAAYPASMVDINFAIRWLKTHAEDLGSRSNLVGILGTSSGAHQAMLTAMRPRDPRYCSIPLSVADSAPDATVRCVVMLWPVIDPLSRYRYAKALKNGDSAHREIADRWLPHHDQYWQTEEAMAEGNPLLALERGEVVDLPPVLYLQAATDIAHPRRDLDRFVLAYRRAGGVVDLELYEGEVGPFLLASAESMSAQHGLTRIIEFVHEQLL